MNSNTMQQLIEANFGDSERSDLLASANNDELAMALINKLIKAQKHAKQLAIEKNSLKQSLAEFGSFECLINQTARTTDRHDLAKIFLEQAQTIAPPATNAHVFLLNRCNNRYEPLLPENIDPDFLQQIYTLTDEAILDWIMRENKATVIPDITTADQGHQTLIIPFVISNHNLGFAALSYSNQEVISEPRRNLLSLMASQTASALENSVLIRCLNTHIEMLSTLYKASKLLSSELDLERTNQLILNLVTTETSAAYGSIWHITTDNIVYEVCNTVGDTDPQPKNHIKIGVGLLGWVAKNQRPILIDNYAKDPRFKEVANFKGTVKSILAVPFCEKGAILGIMLLCESQNSTGFSGQNLEFITSIADMLSAATTKSRQYQEQKRLTITDDLSGLYNARFFKHTLQLELKRAERYNQELSIIFLDLDNFKTVNDNLGGHLIGGDVLLKVGQLIKKWLRDTDLVCRYGGDEFTAILPHTSCDQAYIAAERIRENIAQTCFLPAHPHFVLTASIGISSYPLHANNWEGLVSCADLAMYRAKNKDKNKVIIGGVDPA